MPVNPAVQLEREKRKTAREDRLWSLVNDPMVKRLALLSAIVAYSSYVAGKKDSAGATETALAIALPSAGIPMLAADAGVKDGKVLLGLGLVSGGIAAMASDKAVDAVTLEGPADYPLVSLLGPLAGLRWASGKLGELRER